MRFQTGQNLLPGLIIDRTVVVADEREAGERQCSEETGYETIRRLPRWTVLVDGAADLTQAKRQWFCARVTLPCFIFGYIDHRLRRFLRDQFPQFEEAWPCSQGLQWQCWKERPCIVACTIRERTEAHLFFFSLTRCAFHLLVTRGESSVMTRNRFFAVQRRTLLLPLHIEHVGMRQDHATRPGEQREIEIGIEAAGGAPVLDFLKVIRTEWVVLCSYPDEEIEDGQSLLIERGLTRRKHALPELGLVDEIKSLRDGQRRIEEELLQWSSPGRQTRLGIDTARLALSTAARNGVSFGKIQVKHRFVLLFIVIEVEQ